MLTSNISLEITALIFAIFILFHFLSEKKINDNSNRIFGIFLGLGIIDIVMDIASTIFLEVNPGEHVFLAKLTLTILYLTQTTILLAFVQYTRYLLNWEINKLDTVGKVCAWTTIVMDATIICNWWTGYFFYYDSDGVYRHGTWYLLMYIYALAYVIVAGVLTVYHRREFTRLERTSLWEYLIIIVISVFIQFFSKNLLTIGVGIGLGLTILYITISNPKGYMDSSTGIPDRTYFIKWMKEKQKLGESSYLVCINLHKWNWLKNAYGVDRADQLVMMLVNKLRDIPGSKVFMIGFKSFAIDTDTIYDCDAVARCIIDQLETPVKIDNRLVKIPAKLCKVEEADKFDDPTTVLDYMEYIFVANKDIDSTVYIEDNARYRQGFHRDKEVERFLEVAINKDLFTVAYQPVCSVEDDRIVSMEVLSRLTHPKLGVIPPDLFIGIAEKTGRIAKIGNLQLNRVCKFMREHREILDEIDSVKINMSPQELLKDYRTRMIIDTIRKYGLPLDKFQFEITETIATNYCDIVLKAVDDFAAVGIKLCLDDFGSGFANLNTVLKLPFDTIKMDRSLLFGILDNEKTAHFYENTISSLKGMGFHVLSEGVEEESEYKLLKEWGVDMIQGYYFSKPLPENEIVKLFIE